MKKKVLITSVHMGIGGIETVLLELMRNLEQDKYDIDLVLLKKNGENYNSIPSNINVYSINELKKGFKFLNLIIKKDNKVSKTLRRLLFNEKFVKFWITKKKYDIAVAFSGYHLFMDLYAANANASKKIIWVHTDMKWLVDNNPSFKKRFFEKSYKYKYFDKIISVSKSVKEQMQHLLPNYSDKLDYIWNFFPRTKILVKNNTVLEGEYKILSVGRLTHQKGFGRLVEIHKNLVEKGYDVQTYIAGDGEQRSFLEKKICDYNLTDSIHLLGMQLNIFDLMRQADLFVLTSHSEGLCTVLIESLISKLPFVAPNVTGVRDIANGIAPPNSCILTNDNIEDITTGVISALNGNISNNFEFDVDKYNLEILKEVTNLFDGGNL